MTHEKIKEILIGISPSRKDFSVLCTGKSSKKVNGLYKPATAEILLHNKNFTTDNQLIYTAIHEYAHHLRWEVGDRSPRAHSIEFWALFNTLLDVAEEQHLYQRTRSEKLVAKIEEAKKLQSEILALERKLGLLLSEIHQDSIDEAVRYEDVIQHDLQLSLVTARKLGEISAIPSSKVEHLSLDAARQLIAAKGNEAVQAAIAGGKSIAQIKKVGKKTPDDTDGNLEREKNRLERTIAMLQRRLESIVQELELINHEGQSSLLRTG